MKILIADDNKVERLILAKVLERIGHEVIQAATGSQAIELYFEQLPALVFLDVLMPDLEGYDVASAVKKRNDSRWVPIIFLTSLTDAYDLAKCIECGGDDFVSKPIDRIIIEAKVNAFARISSLYETIELQKAEIQYHHDHLIQEQEAAKKIFNNIAHRGCLGADNINYHLSPMSIFNGDLMLAAETPMGGMRLMLADFTGHGLPAAIGAVPTSEIFYGMSRKGFSIQDMMVEMNVRLFSVLPRGIFCCVIIADIDALDKKIRIWNAGAPQAYILDQETGHVDLIHSKHLPLGVQSPQKFEVEPDVYEFSTTHKLLAVTDGIVESVNQNSEMFGEERILTYIKANTNSDNLCYSLIAELVLFSGGLEQGDDLSLLEVAFPHHHLEQAYPADSQVKELSGTLDSKFGLCLRGVSLRKFDPIPWLLQTLLECKELTPHRSRLFTILSELFNNALEHGVLGLDSAIKEDNEGFTKYYRQRFESLLSLQEGFVQVEVEHKPVAGGGEIIFDFIDSGEGFDFKKALSKRTKHFSGRGLPLLLDLCDSLEFFKGGRHVRVSYCWQRNEAGSAV